VNKALLDTDIHSEVLKAVDQNVARNAIQQLGYPLLLVNRRQ
jgi:hypothetical protein